MENYGKRIASVWILLFVAGVVTSSFAQGVQFQTSSSSRLARGEGMAEVAGEVVLQATNAGTIVGTGGGSVITITYDANITNTPTLGNVTCVPVGVCPDAVTASGKTVNLVYNAGDRTFATGNSIVVSGIRIDVAGLRAGVDSLSCRLSSTSADGARPITFTRALLPVASLVSPSLIAVNPSTSMGAPGAPLCFPTCVIGGGHMSHVAVRERFPAALTSAVQEAALSATPLPATGSQIRVQLTGLPKGIQITALAPVAPVAPALLTVALPDPFPVSVTSTGEDIVFTYSVTDSNLTLAETIVLPFTAGLPPGSGGVPAPLETVIVTAEVSLGPVGGTSIIRFAPNILGADKDFRLALSTTTPVVPAGRPATFTVFVEAIGGFDAPVSLGCNGLPTSATCIFSPNPAAPGKATLTVNTSTFMPAGTLEFRLIGASASLFRSARASLTIGPPPPGTPLFSPASITNAASLASGLSPGAIVTIFGSNLTKDVSGVVTAEQFPLPVQLRGTSVTINGIPAPLLAVANAGGREQINLQAPYELTGVTAAGIVIQNNGVENTPLQARVFLAQPGIFTADGSTGIILHNSDFQPVTRFRPAAKGEAVAIYGTGLGPVIPARTGLPAESSPPAVTTFVPTVTVAGVAAEVLFSGLAPGFAGLYQVNIRIPENVPSGDLDVVLVADGRASNAVKMAVQ